MTKRQKAIASAAGIIPVTIQGILLISCHCTAEAFAVEIAVGLVYFTWVLL